MSYRYAITDKQLAPFLEAAKSLPIPVNKVPPAVVEEVLTPTKSSNPLIVTMHQALITEAIKSNTKNVKEYKEQWYCDKAEDNYVATKEEEEAKQRAEAAAKKAEEDAKAAAEKENEHTMDVNSEGEDEVDQDETPKLKLKSCPIVDSESEEETEEVKVKRRKVKGKGKAIDTEYKRNTVPVDYIGCPGVPVRKMCEGFCQGNTAQLQVTLYNY
ncbi:hypothetical protein M422DRAFT_250141 [Sphaerobolus stellatus SS14]|nr:hypothetical protein M422DRAFT_250141 [Sphaerobolus stellatus SS14]